MIHDDGDRQQKREQEQVTRESNSIPVAKRYTKDKKEDKEITTARSPAKLHPKRRMILDQMD